MQLLLIIAALATTAVCIPTWQDDLSFSDPFQLDGLLSDIEGLATEDQKVGDNPAPCCLPKQWQGMIKTLTGISGGRPREDDEDEVEKGRPGGKGKAKASTMMLYVDETNKRTAGYQICPITKKKIFSFIMTFKSAGGAALNVYNEDAKKCKTFDLAKAKFKDQCIPKDATFGGSFSLGAASGGLAVNSFFYNATNPKKRFGMMGNSLVTPDACIPIVSHAVGGTKGRLSGLINMHDEDDDEVEDEEKGRPRPPSMGFVSSSYFYDLKTSISDPSVFTPPSYCSKVGALLFKKPDEAFDQFADALKWKSLF